MFVTCFSQRCRKCALPRCRYAFCFHPFWVKPPLAHLCRFFGYLQCICFSSVFSRHFRDFDATLGFPGEGPQADTSWKLICANIGSLNTNVHWRSWQAQTICLQETRIGKNGIRTATKTVASQNLQLFHGKPLPGLLSTHGVKRTPHGGVAILTAPDHGKDFDPQHDASGLYPKIFASKRAHAVWVQVSRHLRILVINVYCKTGASQDRVVQENNNLLLQDLFTFACQFGSIPVVIAGDFQLPPLEYEAVSQAVNFHQWNDTLAISEDPGLFRPLTFSADGSFTGPGDGCSSIDGVLTNAAASAALVRAEVLPLLKVQHRPLCVTFQWTNIWQRGFTLHKTAPLNLNDLHQHVEQDFSEDLVAECHGLSIEDCWQKANCVAIDSLLDKGASWGPGPQTRGKPVLVRSKSICPGQNPNGCATTKRSSWLHNALGGLREILFFHTAPIAPGPRRHIQRRTILKAWNRLHWLRAPCLWPHDVYPDLVQTLRAVQWVQDAIATDEIKTKLRRIQRWKLKIQQSAQAGSSFVYQHLKNRAADEPPNLVTDHDGNIVTDPQEAIAMINHQWDDIFSANLGFPPPHHMLEVVWPHIHHCGHAYAVPELQAQDLQKIIHSRKKHAAPGLDGWRTAEMQAISISALHIFAYMFRRLEQTDEPLPQALATAKQIILNKNGSSEPLQERLITLLPVIMLAYTGARFHHLREWQMVAMPRQLQGGIPHRSMPAIHTSFALRIDDAKNSDQAMLGVKIDKAKCFDRIIPSYAAALMLAFGVPKCVIVIFTKLYQQLVKHLAFKSWFAPLPTHGPNGVAQGCSLSLIAINVHMKAWVHLIAILPDVMAQAFIDDAYLWVNLSHANDLRRAIEITEQWDALVGQAMNWGKCTVWGTTTDARKTAKTLFPTMKFALELEVLGVNIRTSRRNAMNFSETKCAKILADIHNIAALPLSTKLKAKLIATKVIPQCTYCPTLNHIPARQLSRIQSAIANVFWGKRPHWRSRFLVFALLTKPHRVEPMCARNYHVILDCLRFLQHYPEEHTLFRNLLRQANPTVPSFAQTVKQAFRFHSLELTSDAEILFRGKPVGNLFQLTPKDVKPVLQLLSRQACYAQASLQSRKEFRSPAGVLDSFLSTLFLRKSQLCFAGEVPAHAFFEAQVVGCVLTNDRLAAANLVESSQCRLCHTSKESIPHLLRDCPFVQEHHPAPPVHELGRNFEFLGIVEHPWAILSQRLQISNPWQLNFLGIDTTVPPCVLWTDGSLMWAEDHVLTTAGFAVVDHNNVVLAQGPVCHWLLTSYTAELWGLIIGFSLMSGPVEIRSDCQTLVKHVQHMIETESVQSTWPHYDWWRCLLQAWLDRRAHTPAPLSVKWIPAHKLEHIPEHLIDDDMATANATTVCDIIHNRKADHAAKQATMHHCPLFHKMFDELCHAVLLRQEWLTNLCHLIGTQVPPRADEPCSDNDEATIAPKDQFPRLPWKADRMQFTWNLSKPWPDNPFPHSQLLDEDWVVFGRFFRQLQWKVEASCVISHAEIALLFYYQGFQNSDIRGNEHYTFQDLIVWFKRCLKLCRKGVAFPIFPGQNDSRLHNAWGKSMPAGAIVGAMPYMPDDFLEFLAVVSRRVIKANLETWSFPVSLFPR